MNLASRLKKLESRWFDATGLVPHSESWFAFWEDQFDRLVQLPGRFEQIWTVSARKTASVKSCVTRMTVNR